MRKNVLFTCKYRSMFSQPSYDNWSPENKWLTRHWQTVLSDLLFQKIQRFWTLECAAVWHRLTNIQTEIEKSVKSAKGRVARGFTWKHGSIVRSSNNNENPKSTEWAVKEIECLMNMKWNRRRDKGRKMGWLRGKDEEMWEDRKTDRGRETDWEVN